MHVCSGVRSVSDRTDRDNELMHDDDEIILSACFKNFFFEHLGVDAWVQAELRADGWVQGRHYY